MRTVLAAVALATVIGSFLACGGAPTADIVALPARSAEPARDQAAGPLPSGAPRDPSDPAAWSGSAWTDDEVAAALAKDCHWDPSGCLESLRDSASKSVEEISPERPECMPVLALACARVPLQSCAPDECSQSDYDCLPACNADCRGCGETCADGCEQCKAGCTDDACRLACGQRCAACRQACQKELDHCTSAHCAEVAEECYRARDDEWNAATCETVCPRVEACVEKCPEIENDWSGQRYAAPCAKSCLARFGKGCPARFDRICAGDPNASVNFSMFHATRAARETKGN